MAYNEDIEIRSEEVQEILGTPPKWLVRNGSTVAFIAVVVLIWVAYWVEYPDVVQGKIVVTSTEPPYQIYSPTTGYIERVLVRNEQVVDSGMALLAFRSTANIDDVFTFETALDQIKEPTDSALLAFQPPTNLILGEIQNNLYDFLEKQEAYRNSMSSDRPASVNVRSLNRKIERLEQEIRDNNQEKRRIQDQLELMNDRLSRAQRQYQERQISLRQLRETQDVYRNLERARQGLESDNKSKQFEIQMLRDEVRGARSGNEGENTDMENALKQSFLNLQEAVAEWRQRNVVTSPVRGIVAFTNSEVKIEEQQFILKDVELMSVVPLEETEITGEMSLDLDGSGKVAPGQRVVVKFKSYPFYEYGAVEGTVKWKGRVPSDDGKIPVEVAFPDTLETTRGRTIEAAQVMNGTAEIITSEKRLIEKIFESFRRVSQGGAKASPASEAADR
jgi:multidrug resistance efflux pump